MPLRSRPPGASSRSTEPTRSRFQRAFVGILVGILGLVWLGATGAEDPLETEPATATLDRFARGDVEPPSTPAVAHHPTTQDAHVATPELRDVREARLIASVRFAPEAPCVGEDVRVDVDLRDEAGHARVVIEGRSGAPGAIRPDVPGPRDVRVLVRTWDDRYERHVARVHVRDCGERLGARVVTERVAERRYVWRLEPSPPGEIAWDLGDGTTAVGARIEHRYAPRLDRTHATYAITARYEGPSGTEIARASVTHVEAEGLAARSAAPVVRDDGERFVAFGADGLRTTRSLTNPLDLPFELEVAELRGFPCDGSPAQRVEVPASHVFDATRLEPAATVDVGLVVAAELFDAPICQLVVRAGGRVGGRVATTTVVLDTGVPDERRPIEDERTLAAIAALAAERPGAPITAEEIAAHLARTDG